MKFILCIIERRRFGFLAKDLFCTRTLLENIFKPNLREQEVISIAIPLH